MTERRRMIADAGLAVLAAKGLRGVTHRAIDAAADLPEGSTSNLFRTKQALLDGLVERFVERDLEAVQAVQTPPDLSSPSAFARELAQRIAALTRPPMASLTRARLELCLHRDIDLSPQHLGFIDMIAQLLVGLGADRPEARARTIADYLDGLILHTLAMPARAFDADEAANAIEALIGPVDPDRRNVDNPPPYPGE